MCLSSNKHQYRAAKGTAFLSHSSLSHCLLGLALLFGENPQGCRLFGTASMVEWLRNLLPHNSQGSSKILLESTISGFYNNFWTRHPAWYLRPGIGYNWSYQYFIHNSKDNLFLINLALSFHIGACQLNSALAALKPGWERRGVERGFRTHTL